MIKVTVMKERTIRFSGKSIDIFFTVDRCTHVAECIRGAPKVFDSTRRPWIIADAESPDKIAEVVMRCPTGALHFNRKDGGTSEPILEENKIIVNPHGAFYARGDLEIQNFDSSLIVKDTRIGLCRCGQSSIKPLCDESHKQHRFKDRKPFFKEKNEAHSTKGKLVITLKKNSPLSVDGPVQIFTPEGDLLYSGKRTTLCRCGNSERMPFCDGSHNRTGFITKDKITLYPLKSDMTGEK